ncbi:monothiol glutaredoxin-S5-like [Dioscorea cayenensis subsp. rotundata]|uniref:Monothiol glutaredoxin-S5-like n=1 Tax=Dioscorea cayennensis subsp. rotundata TaxID=55577 RepID=A0AB40C227_DIOCR|nr:monothiol glutaredoxin-S5-like [Dioscorea cayenensis subsp. rotundata]
MEQFLMAVIKEEGLISIVKGSMVVIVGKRACYMSYVAQRLLEGLKVYPTIYEVSEVFVARMTLIHNLGRILSKDDNTLVAPLFPVVFIVGKLVGGLNRLIAIHITGELIPMLTAAGAIWF